MASPTKLPPHESILERFPDHAKAIGMISVEIANLDIFLGELLGGILCVHPDVGRVIYLTPHSAIGRVEILKRVANLVLQEGSEGLKRVNSIVGRAEKAIGKRHALIHDAWGMTKETGDIHQMTMPNLTPRPHPTDITTLRRILSDIRSLGDDVRQEVADVYADLHSQSQRKSAPQIRVPRKIAKISRGKSPHKK